jgi:hypothetical protein
VLAAHANESVSLNSRDYREEEQMYNLLTEEWIPVLYADGKWKHVGLLKVLNDAHRIRSIAASNPMDRFAVLRFLLAVLYWCKGNPTEADRNVTAFPEEWFAKLDAHRECFNLLGAGARFYQDPEMCTKKPGKSALYLTQEVPTGTNAWHFRHVSEGENGLCPACCALGLVRLPVFATSGGQGLSPGINAKPPAYGFACGATLFETLLFSWNRVDELGKPEWTCPQQSLPPDGRVPLLLGLTWLPRRVWLAEPDESRGWCESCGEIRVLIRQCVFAGRGSSKTDEGQDREWNDPHILSTEVKGKRRILYAADVLASPDAASDQWVDMVDAARCRAQSRESDTQIIGFSTIQNDKYLEAVSWKVPALQTDISTREPSQRRLADWRSADNKLQQRLRNILEHKPPGKGQHDTVESIVAAFRPHVEHVVSQRAAELVQGGAEGWKQAASEWEKPLEVAARSLAPDYTTEVLLRRREIERALPRWSKPQSSTDKTQKARGKRA